MSADKRGLKTGLCAAWLLLFTDSLSAGEIWTRLGSVEVSGTDSTFRVREGSREWTIDLAPILAKNCQVICEGEPNSRCPSCVPTYQVVAWDEHYRRIYFAVAIGPSWDKPWAIYNYSLTTHRITQFTGTDATHFVSGTVSDSGRYLAYLKMHHQSAAGPCRSQTDVEIVDLWNRRVGAASSAFASSEDCVVINKLKWSSPTSLEYMGSTCRSDGTAIPGGEVAGQVDVGKLSFH
jgi:hypothetical protein